MNTQESVEPENIKAFIVDDHPPICFSSQMIIEKDPRFTFAGSAGTLNEALPLIASERPDVVLLDESLPDGSGISSIPKILKANPGTSVVIYSANSTIVNIIRAFQLGARGYLSKTTFGNSLLRCLQDICEGKLFVDSATLKAMLDHLVSRNSEEMTAVNIGELSTREKEVFDHIGSGNSVKEIAESLYLSPKTVENHRLNIMKKLKIQSTSQLAVIANQFVDPLKMHHDEE